MVKNNISEKQKNLMAILFFVLGIYLLFTVAADASATGMPWEGPVEKFKNSISGPWATAVATIGVVAAGAGLIFGGDQMGQFMKTAFYLVLVIALIISTNGLISMYSTSGALI